MHAATRLEFHAAGRGALWTHGRPCPVIRDQSVRETHACIWLRGSSRAGVVDDEVAPAKTKRSQTRRALSLGGLSRRCEGGLLLETLGVLPRAL